MLFNFKRFINLLKQDFLINKTKYLLAILGLGLVTYILSYWFLNSNKENMIRYDYAINQNYLISFTFYILLVGAVVGTAFPDLSDKIKTSSYLLNPGSSLEKLMVQFVLRIGLFVPIALITFWICIRLAKASLTPGISGLDPAVIPYFEFRFLITRSPDKIWDTWQILFGIFGLFSYGAYLFAGAAYFKRYALVKTVIVSIVILLFSISFSTFLSHIFYSKETQGFEIKLKEFALTEHWSSLELFYIMLSMLSWIFFLTLAYFKLKEREV